MTAIAGVLRSERWLDEVVVAGTSANIDGDFHVELSLPAGIGDLAIMEALLDVDAILTAATNLELQGIRWAIIDAAGTTVDILGVTRWSQREATNNAISTYLSPDPLVLWRQNERLSAKFREVDTNAAPTADLGIVVKTVRVRPLQVAERHQPLRLVR